MEGYTEEEYNKMLIEILDRSIELGYQCIVMSLFIFVESILLLFDYIKLDAFYVITIVLALIKYSYNNHKIKLNDVAIQYIIDLRDKENT